MLHNAFEVTVGQWVFSVTDVTDVTDDAEQLATTKSIAELYRGGEKPYRAQCASEGVLQESDTDHKFTPHFGCSIIK